MDQKKSVPSILAAVCAALSFFSGAFWGFILAIAAMVLGLIGIALALSPRVRGGFLSLFSVVAGVLALLAAILKIIF